ncbi:MAG: murein biosynthesis integral membrane protein MurJ [Candidatus Portiera sp.]|nr:murein biosynthesis integral membrane protein MurJ [Portiera sp.]
MTSTKINQEASKDKKPRRPLISGLIISAFTFLSRIFGLFRDIALAATFGGSGALDAFLIAFRIPNFFRRIFAEGAFVQALLPMIVEFQSKGDKQALKDFLSHTLGFMILLLGIFCALGIIFSDYLTLVFAAGFANDLAKFNLTSSMLQITFSYLLLITLTAYFMALQNSVNKFALPAATPIILNISLLYAILIVSPNWQTPIMAAAWGVLFAGCIQMAIQIPAVYKCGLLILPKFKWTLHHSVKRLLKVMAPILLSGSIVQINLIIDLLLASFLVVGSIAWLSFSERLIQLPLGVFGIALTTVMMPKLSRLHHTANTRATNHFIDWAMRVALLIALPAAIGLIIMAKPLLASIYLYGSFTENDIINSASALRAYAIGLPGFILIKVLSSVFFAKQDTKTPLKATLAGVIVGIVGSLSLIWFLQHVGLALATSISASFNALILGVVLYRNKSIRFNLAAMKFLSKLVIALVVLVIFLIYLAPHIQIGGDDWLAMQANMRLINLLIIIPSAVIIYVLSLLISGLRWKHINIK